MPAEFIGDKKMVYEDFREMEIPDGDNSLYELIGGQVLKRPIHKLDHQATLGNLMLALYSLENGKQIGWMVHGPLDIVLDEENCVMPDFIFVATNRKHLIDPDNGVNGAPDLLVEVLSKDTAWLDKGIKKDLYERFQVKEYWIADPVRRSIEVYALVDGRYKLVSFAEEEGQIRSEVLGDFELEVSTLFA